MRVIAVKIDGGTSQERAEVKGRQTRLLSFPDGIDRLVTMPGWFWQTKDKMIENGWPDDFEETALRLSTNFYHLYVKSGVSFEQHLVDTLMEIIRIFYEAKWPRRRSNNNGFYDDYIERN